MNDVECYAAAQVVFEDWFHTRECTTRSAENVDVQIQALEALSEFLHDLATIPNSIGLTPFHAVAEMEYVLGCAIGNLRATNQLFALMRHFHSMTGVDGVD